MKLIRNHWTLFLPVLLLCLCMAAVCSADAIPENAADLTEGITADAAVSEYRLTWFRFIPEQTAAYSFYSGSDSSTHGELYQYDGEQIFGIVSND